jgi:hypothetical protein|tara:strand:+ start:3307 stop:4146 length:840 start_codon:yes stop_codon:yes gene_type:complete
MALTRVKGSVFELSDPNNQDLVAVTVADGDTTPGISGGQLLTTANTGATIISDFDGGGQGQPVFLIINDANTTLNFSTGSLKGNGGVDRLMASGESVIAFANVGVGTWYCHVFPIAATAALAGVVELSTAAENNTGTDAARAVSPDSLAGSYAGTKTATVNVFSPDVSATTGNAKQHFVVTSDLNGMNLIGVEASVAVAGVTGTQDIQVHNLTDTSDMLSTVMTIDTTEVSTTTAATPAVIDTAEDDVVTDDIIRIDVDAIHSGTAAKGLTVFLTFRLP